MPAYYNEIDEEKAAWIRELIRHNVVAAGEVDERSIADVEPSDLRGFTQCHFFAGIAVWSYALRLAGWPDDKPVWTGSCPCPSFSCAGKGEGFDDPRHLWPEFYRLIGESKPPVVFGEQSADAIGHGWWDLVSTDLESEAYAVAAAVLASASVGATDIRHRLYFVGMADTEHSERRSEHEEHTETHGRDGLGRSCDSGGMADANMPSATRQRKHSGLADQIQGQIWRRSSNGSVASGMADTAGSRCDGAGKHRSGLPLFSPRSEQCGPAGRMGNASRQGLQKRERNGRLQRETMGTSARETTICADSARSGHPFADALKGFWRDADWLFCTDGRWRPVEAGTFPLADGSPFRLGRLRGYGDCINAEVAKAFIESCMQLQPKESLV